MSHLNIYPNLCPTVEMHNNISTIAKLKKDKTSTKSISEVFHDNKNLANGAKGKCPVCGQEICICG